MFACVHCFYYNSSYVYCVCTSETNLTAQFLFGNSLFFVLVSKFQVLVLALESEVVVLTSDHRTDNTCIFLQRGFQKQNT